MTRLQPTPTPRRPADRGGTAASSAATLGEILSFGTDLGHAQSISWLRWGYRRTHRVCGGVCDRRGRPSGCPLARGAPSNTGRHPANTATGPRRSAILVGIYQAFQTLDTTPAGWSRTPTSSAPCGGPTPCTPWRCHCGRSTGSSSTRATSHGAQLGGTLRSCANCSRGGPDRAAVPPVSQQGQQLQQSSHRRSILDARNRHGGSA